MHLNRREFLSVMVAASAAGILPYRGARAADALYDLPSFGNVRILHFTDCHAQLLPVYFREPDTNLGFGSARGRPPHLVGQAFLDHFGLSTGSAEAHALTHLDFPSLAEKYGRVGGFAHLSTLISRLREAAGADRTLLLDGGDTWQGSATAMWSQGADMVEACNRLGVDVMTGHWEFTYGEEALRSNLAQSESEFVAQNVFLTEEALFDERPAFDEETGHAFQPYALRDVGGVQVAVIGQAFPYTPVANPRRFVPDWNYGIQEAALQTLVGEIRTRHNPSLVLLLSHNGMDVDLKLASRVSGLDAIFGGHTHDGVPVAVEVKNPGGMTLVTNAGSNGKFLGVMDFQVKQGRMADARYRLLPVFSSMLPPDPEMQNWIDQARFPHLETLNQPLAVAGQTLYRRGNFNGTFDQVICEALLEHYDAEIALSPGFRWGTSVLPGETLTMEHVLAQTAITYPETYMNEMSGEQIKLILEDVADNLFNLDPYQQQGGDMVRVAGIEYSLDPTAPIGDRLRDLRTRDGAALDPKRRYKVTGWGVVGSVAPGPPVWDIVKNWLLSRKEVNLATLNRPRLLNIQNNPGIGI